MIPPVGLLDKFEIFYSMLLKRLFIITVFVALTSCNDNTEQGIDPIAAMFSNTTIAAEKEYRNIDGISLTLDVYVPSKRLGEPPWVKQTEGNKPTLLYFHGGGWRGGEKESRALEILPYVDKGWIVVTANYRLLKQTSLPEIIGDCKTALNWVYNNANNFKIDTTKIIVSGNSAGGHLALMTALSKEDSIYKCDYPIKKRNKVAGVINWYGISDVSLFVKKWKDKQMLFEDQTQLDMVYKKTSPLNFIDDKTMPILTVHGEIDSVVPFIHSKMLHEKLIEKGIKNRLVELKNRKHGNFNAKEMTYSYKIIWKFLEEIGIKNK